MRLIDSLHYAWTSMLAGRVRSALTLLAMSIGVAAVIVLTGVGEGARDYVVDQFASLGTNLVIVIPGRAETASGSHSTFVGDTPRDLTIADSQALQRIPQVHRLAPVVIGEMGIAGRGKERRVPVLGSTASFLHIRHLEMALGRFLPQGDPQISRAVCVLGAKVAREIFGSASPEGEIVRIGEHRCRVIGVMSTKGRSLGLDTEELVVVPVAFAQMVMNTEKLFRILIEAGDRDSLENLKEQVKATIRRRHHGVDDITVITQDSVLNTFERIFTMLTLSVSGIAAISLGVAGILIMNVMLVSISRRTAEIGLLKAMGAKNSQVVGLILLEAMLLSGTGGLLGLGIGMAGGRLVEQFYPDLSATPPSWAVIAALSIALFTGFIFSLLPARRAARLDPVQSLARR
jgi:putative ABC transport system permease protein